MGSPVICAAKTTPGLATRAGPFGPSGVKTRLLPCLRARRMNSRSASFAPREDEPRTVPTPYQRNTRAMISPSFDREVMTVIGSRYFECSISSRCACQKERMYWGVLSIRSGWTCVARSEPFSTRMKIVARM
ncbi:MAG: hypothetical protein QOJ98_197 [Acidobacteriota bacterium]|nr:hypothetical protein [Acidobacteriota bacterium]